MLTLISIILLGLAMSAIALVGSLTLILPERVFTSIILPLVAFAAGSLIGAAFFHLLPEAIIEIENLKLVFILLMIGFIVFYVLEQFLHWHHCHHSLLKHQPVSYLILIADALHNLIGGLAFGAVYVLDAKLGLVMWVMLALHEIPQELGDFGILIHSGWERKSALFFNFMSALTFLIGAVFAYFLSQQVNMIYFLPFAAGNFLYIGAVDLIPQLQSAKVKDKLIQFVAFILGLIILVASSNSA